MAKLYYNPISTYSMKATIAFAEKGVAYEPQIVDLMNPAAKAEYKKVNPHGKVPMLVLDDGWRIPESTIIVEWLDTHHPTGPRLIPEDKEKARRARFHDRTADLYLNDPVVTLLLDPMKPEADREPKRVAAAKETLDTTYELMDEYLGKNAGPWILGSEFTLADCSVAPNLFYAKTTYSFAKHKNVEAYWGRLAERPSVKRAINEALPILQKLMAK